MDIQEKTLQDYLAILSRRKSPMLTTMLMVFLLGVVVALAWPPTYKSSATILIKEQEIPTELVRSTVTSFASQRIQTISQRVMTRSNLMEIVEKYKLYKKERKSKTTEEILEEMREDIALDMIDANIVDPKSGRPGTATIAFTLSFEGSNPSSTQKVTGELTSLFLAENLKTRKEKASETYLFLTEEAKKLSEAIEKSEFKLAEFKEKHANSMPEVSSMNLSVLDRVERELLQVDLELRSREERKFYLKSQLSQINPLTNMRSATGQTILDPASRLKSLESEYVSLTAKYSDEHPDVIKVKREIEGLRSQAGDGASDVSEKAKQLTSQRTALGMLKKKYSVDHPDVITLEKSIAALEKQVLSAAGGSAEKNELVRNPENPAYISTLSSIKTVETEIKSMNERRRSLNEKLAKYEERIALAPQVERDYLMLKRDYENSIRRYQDINSRQMEAEIGQELERESKGESFVLIDPAQFPEVPIKPNRGAIVFLSLVLAVGIGLGLAMLLEALDSSVRGVGGVVRMLTVPPLAVIPLICNTQDLMLKQRRVRIVVGSLVSGIFIVILLVHFFIIPLDVLWFRGLRKAENVIGV